MRRSLCYATGLRSLEVAERPFLFGKRVMRDDLGAVPRVSGEHAVVAQHVKARRRDECAKSRLTSTRRGASGV